jgi:hypothetical protein
LSFKDLWPFLRPSLLPKSTLKNTISCDALRKFYEGFRNYWVRFRHPLCTTPLSAHFGHAGELQRAASGVRSSYHMISARQALS